MSDITLSPDTRFTLLTLQRTAAVQNEVARRLATGLRVERPVDDPVDYYQANALTTRAADLLNARDGIGQGLTSIDAALQAIEGISDLNRQLQGILQSSLGGDAETRAAAATQFDTIRSQITALSQDASVNGVNLVSDPAQTMTVGIDENGDTFDVSGRASDAASLGIGDSASYNNFATDADIRTALDQLSDARATLRGSSASFGGNVAALSIREQFNEDLVNTLETGAQSLVGADLNADAAALLASDLRNQLGYAGLRIVQENTRAIAGLL